MKVLLIGVGNSGTKLLGRILHDMIGKDRYTYHYEPLYWRGKNGEEDIVLDVDRIKEHVDFPLNPPKNMSWPWMKAFVSELNGLAKFVRAGSRIGCFVDLPVQIVWITRELYSFLGSVQANFPRCLPDKGWHHRPGYYDDFARVAAVYDKYNLRADEDCRVEVEAAWWHLHNSAVLEYIKRPNVFHIRYEEVCRDVNSECARLCSFLGLKCPEGWNYGEINPIVPKVVKLLPRNIWMIEDIAGELNRTLYGEHGIGYAIHCIDKECR